MTASTPTYEDAHGEDPSSGILRASVFGASDGLVSNLGVVVGVGAAPASSGPVLVAGIAALVAGAFSMAAGEYVSMRTQREVLERELAVESDHIAEHPGEEEAHLAELLADNGLDSATAPRGRRGGTASRMRRSSSTPVSSSASTPARSARRSVPRPVRFSRSWPVPRFRSCRTCSPPQRCCGRSWCPWSVSPAWVRG